MRTDLESYLLAMPYIKIHETYIHVYYLSLLKRVAAMLCLIGIRIICYDKMVYIKYMLCCPNIIHQPKRENLLL